MATVVTLRHPKTGLVKNGFYGFSWTTLFFGPLPAFFRGDVGTGAVILAIETLLFLYPFFISAMLFNFIWAFLYNKRYTQGLIEQGYELTTPGKKGEKASEALDLVDDRLN